LGKPANIIKAAFVVALLDSDDPPDHGDDEEDRELSLHRDASGGADQ
jgi:hypothetical protein